MKDDVQSLSHSKWRCKYHIVFAPKYRRRVVYGKIKADVGKILRELSERKGVKILEAECCPDHIHMLVAIPPHMSVSEYMGYLKSKSSLMIFDRHALGEYFLKKELYFIPLGGLRSACPPCYTALRSDVTDLSKHLSPHTPCDLVTAGRAAFSGA